MSLDAADLLAQAARRGGVLVTVLETWGSNPRPVGSHLVAWSDTDFAGSVSSGCIEPMVVPMAVASGEVRHREVRVTSEAAQAQGLACGGRLLLRFEPATSAIQPLAAAIAGRRLAMRVAFGGQTQLVIDDPDSATLIGVPDAVLDAVRRGLVDGQLRWAPDGSWLVQPYLPAPRLVVVGGTHIAQRLAAMAPLAGWSVEVIDPRPGFATEERFPGATVHQADPAAVLGRRRVDARTAVVVLSHQPSIDDPVLIEALAGPAMYVGALGSRRTHALRVERLAAAGLTAAQIGRLSAPVGLDIGAKGPGGIAVSILAEMVSHRVPDGGA